MATLISRTSDLTWPPDEMLDPDGFDVSYDRLSDELLVYFSGRDFPAASFPVSDDADHIYLLGDVETGRVVGLHVEGFLAYAVKRLPPLIDLLDIADLRGITPAEVAEVRRGLMVGDRRRATLAALLTVVDAEVAASTAATPMPAPV